MEGPATTSNDDGDGVDNASPSPRAVQMGSTDSSDGHLRSSSDFEAATAAAAIAANAATATAATADTTATSDRSSDEEDPNGQHSLPSPEAAAADNALRSRILLIGATDDSVPQQSSMDMDIGTADDNSVPQQPQHIHQQHHHHRHVALAPPRLITVVPPIATSSDVDPEHTPGAAAAPDTTAHLNKDFIRELLAWYRNRSWQKKLVTAAFFVVACVVYADLFGLFWEDSKIHAGLELFLEWMDYHSVAASFAFVGMFVLTTLMFVPPFLMTFGAGFVFVEVYGFAWGMALAMATCFLGSCVGGVIAFARARYISRELVKLFAKRYPIIRAVDRALKRKGFKVMVLLRLCSIIPFSALNYIGGVTGVQLSAFVCSMVGILPSQLLTVFFGATAGSLKNSAIAEAEWWTASNIVWLSVTGACGVLAIFITIYFARKEIKKELEREDTQSLNPDSVRSMMSLSQAGDDFESEGTAGDSERERKSEEWWWVWA